MLIKPTIFVWLCFLTSNLAAQLVKHALFIGNSYTSYNNLPQMVSSCASSTGDQLVYDSNTPGGSSLQGHTSNTTTIDKIQIGNWDFVALQEQSQRPSFPDAQVAQDVFPFATQLNNLIEQYNPCAETVFYMTWGRKNGDAQNCPTWPPVCTYSGMDSLLYLRYMQMAATNQACVSPVGAVWKYLRLNHPQIELYNADESHPSYAGSYAAACSFYAVIFRKNPNLITWNGTLSAQDAAILRNAAKVVVFDQLTLWRVGLQDPVANFETTNTGTFEAAFLNTSSNYETSSWYVDGILVSTDHNLTHTFAVTGPHQVKLVVEKCGYEASLEQEVLVGFMSIDVFSMRSTSIYPNPTDDMVYIDDVIGNSIFIFDLSGKLLIETSNHASGRVELNISKLQPGIFVVVVDEKRYLLMKK